MLAALLALAIAGTPRAPRGESRPVRADAAVAVDTAAGGWRPHNLRVCALAIGMIVGGGIGLPLNPLGGAAAVAYGLAIGSVSCT